MGGIIFREFVLSCHDQLQPSVPIYSAVLLASPNHGSALASVASCFWKSNSLGDLSSGKDSYINSLNERWVAKFNPETTLLPFLASAGYELHPTHTKIIVENEAATAYASRSLGFPKNHKGIAKPMDKVDCGLYNWVKQNLLRHPHAHRRALRW